jgi:hypothetical protein
MIVTQLLKNLYHEGRNVFSFLRSGKMQAKVMIEILLDASIVDDPCHCQGAVPLLF